MEIFKNIEVAFQYYKAWELKSSIGTREKPCVINAVELPLEEVGQSLSPGFSMYGIPIRAIGRSENPGVGGASSNIMWWV